MATTPKFDITPPTSASNLEQDVGLAQRASRSKFKSFFGLRRPSPGLETGNTTPDHHKDLTHSAASQPDRQHLSVFSKPSFATRAWSDTSIPQSVSAGTKGRHPPRNSSRISSVPDSKTFMHVCSRASQRSTARTFVKASSERTNAGRAKWSESHATTTTPLSSRRGSFHDSTINIASDETSLPGVSNMVEKLFVLGEGAEFLQYSANGDPDRLPERILRLTPESLVLPSDAFTGQGMALEITTSIDTSVDLRPKTNRATWTKNPFRASTMKRPADSLIMVFDDVDLMSTWLTSLRKVIEGTRGPSHRPSSAWCSTEKPLPPLRNASTERFSLRQSFLHLSRSSSSLRHDSADGLESKDQTLLPLPPPPPSSYQRSASPRSRTASSINTTSSLDRLRESDSNSTSTGATNSLDGSVVLDSPVKETFANIVSPSTSIDSRTNAFSESFSQRSLPFSPQTLQERRKASVSQLRLGTSSETNVLMSTSKTQGCNEREIVGTQATETDNETPADQDPKTRPVSILAPLPSPDDIRRPFKLTRTQSSGFVEALDQPKVVRPASSHEGHRPKLSADATNKSMYSLFPKKRVEPVKSEPLVVPETNNIPGLSQSHATNHLILPPTPTVAITPAVCPASTKNSSRKPSPIKLLAAIEMEQPQRSPAVTDDMLASNFGTIGYKVLPSPVSPSNINVPTFDDLKFDFSFLKHDFVGADRRRSNSPPNERNDGSIRRLKSTPSLRVSRAPSAPLGPPPTGPLPAVPPEDSLSSHPGSPHIKSPREQRKSSRSGNSSPSSLAHQKSPKQSSSNPTSSSRSGSVSQPEVPPKTSSPLAPVGMPSIVSPPSVPIKTHDRQKSSSKSSSSIETHSRAKSSGKHSLSMNVKAFPSAPVLCDKPTSFFC